MTPSAIAGRHGFFRGEDRPEMPSGGWRYLQPGQHRSRDHEPREVPATDQVIRASAPARRTGP